LESQSTGLSLKVNDTQKSNQVSEGVLQYWLARAALQKKDFLTASEAFRKLLSNTLPLVSGSQTGCRID
jgi:hypothetical protein